LSKLIEGIRVKEFSLHVDERGFFTEILRDDWNDFLQGDSIIQLNLSYSYPGIVRAWHQHIRGQNDYFICINGALKICAYDDRVDSETCGELDEIIISSETFRIVRIPGILWHGYKAIGDIPFKILCGVNKLYDYENPDEKRRPWNDPTIIPHSINGKTDDPRVGSPWNWNHHPHK